MKILISDSNVIYRKKISEFFLQNGDCEVLGTASTLSIACKKIDLLEPEVLILDVDLIEKEKREVLSALYSKNPGLITIVTTFDVRGTKVLVENLIGSALYDIIVKEKEENFKNSLFLSINRLKNRTASQGSLNRDGIKPDNLQPFYDRPEKQFQRCEFKINKLSLNSSKEVVAIGISTGGPKALSVMMPMIPADIKTPILIVQHMPPKFTRSMSDSLNSRCRIKVKEASQGDILEAGTAFVAQGGKHMAIERTADNSVIIKIFDGEPVNNCKPAVDVLFHSVAGVYREKSVGVIMTGMGSDGTKGLREMKKNGAHVIAQNEETCVVFGMPRYPIEEGLVDVVSPLENIADEIVKAVGLKKNNTGVKI